MQKGNIEVDRDLVINAILVLVYISFFGATIFWIGIKWKNTEGFEEPDTN